MKTNKHFFIFIFLTLNLSYVFSQDIKLCPKTENKKAEKLAGDAESQAKNISNYEKVKKLCEEAAEEDTGYAKPMMILGDMAYRKKDFTVMYNSYKRMIEICADASAMAHYRTGYYLYEKKQYEEAAKYFKSFLSFAAADEKLNKDAELKIFRATQFENPVPFNPQVVKGLSTADPEYLAIISPDNELCFFTRRFEYKGKNMLTPTGVEKFMMSEFKNGEWTSGEMMPFPFNKNNSGNEGGATVTIDNKHLFFTVNNKGNFDIYTSDLGERGWSEPASVSDSINNHQYWDSQPSISSDGKTLYFVSARDSVNLTNSDIYVSKKHKGNNWNSPELLPNSINTFGREKTPFIFPDNRTFYFSSDSLPGMGGYDIFVCKIDDNGKWSKPVNLGYPINTDKDELGFFVSTDGKKGYFASNNLSSNGGYDIYSFDLNKEVQPEKVLFVKGQLKDEMNEIPLAAKIELRNVATQETTEVEYDLNTGKYASVVLFRDDYIMTVKGKDAAFTSAYFEKGDTALLKPAIINLEVKKIKIGESYTLNNIYFASDSYVLKDGSKEVVKDFASFLKEYPNIKVAINGHTDNVGVAAENIVLSKQRAKAVYDFLVATGIAATRLTYDGIGQNKPVASNATEEGRAKNRRTEFVIISK
ncbi:MAG TPA: OmpA family protein [Bacteroidia bacterium]|nr:OmpA family protein [Bacteroidia bacterium]HNU33113.1 OmpA family protein [Bacteroidia bacterium]